jgi:hypothetical protein
MLLYYNIIIKNLYNLWYYYRFGDNHIIKSMDHIAKQLIAILKTKNYNTLKLIKDY